MSAALFCKLLILHLEVPCVTVFRAVVPANTDVATQEIVRWTNDVDPGRRRTLVALTKPDLVDKGAEKLVSSPDR